MSDLSNQQSAVSTQPKLTHQALVKVAQRWLVNQQRCSVVLTEIVTTAGEIPDAIGWRHCSYSILIECKVSRSDFLADKHKPSRRSGLEMGGKRFYLAPKGMIKAEELPEGWGLLEYSEEINRTKLVKDVEFTRDRTPSDYHGEIALLVSALRRIKQREFICIVPESSPEPAQ